MPAHHTADEELFDARGFLREPDRWTEDIGERLAVEHGVALSDEHRRVIASLRQNYLATSNLPVEQTLCAALNMKPGCLARLFGGPLTAWMVAGLPDPGLEARTYMENLEVVAPDAIGQGAPGIIGGEH